MLVLKPGETLEIPFVYRSGYDYVDPEDNIRIFLKRGASGVGPIITGPYIYNTSLAIASTPSSIQYFSSTDYLERVSEGSYTLKYQIPNNLFDGDYVVQISTILNGVDDIKEYNVQVKSAIQISDTDYSLFGKAVSVGLRSKYKPVDQFNTNNIMLIGHTDALVRYEITKVASIQDAVNILRADLNSPLLRGVFDAYSCGARDIFIMSAGPMSEYVANVAERNSPLFKDDVNNTYTFYENYFNNLAICYGILEQYDYLDFIVPLEASMINTGTVNFGRQLANLCNNIQTNTGEVCMGVLGSRNQGINSEDVQTLLDFDFEIENEVDSSGLILTDSGKYLVMIYGEGTFAHRQMQLSYSSSLAAAMAGMLASTQVNFGVSNQRVASAVSGYGVELTTAQIKSLNDIGINCLTKGARSRRFAGPYDVYISGDFTMSISESFKDSSNVRLAAMVISEVQAIGRNSLGKFSTSKIEERVDALMKFLQINDIIKNYKLDMYADKTERGKLYFDITIISSRTLREISFSVGSGRSA
jgi:hypothetical protein